MAGLRLAPVPGWAVVATACCAAGACLDPPLLPPPDADGGTQNQAGFGAAEPDAGEASSTHAGAPTTSTGGANGGAGAGSTGGNAPAGSASGGDAAGGSGGSAGAPSRVTWLALEGSRAPGSSEPNRELAIDGAFYAYADDCTLPSLQWDESTRCVSGMLCDAGTSFENWGVAVGFDFNNTGPSGEPPDAKRLWDPRDVSAEGVAWSVSGVAPSLQVWVLNMDPMFGGQCTAETCEILGPPDGVAAAPKNGELLFASMQKDDWGGSGESYNYDPALVHALQFKIATIVTGPKPFSFCIDALGIIR